MLILTSTESSDSSYYGEQGLHFLAVNGDSCVVPLSKSQERSFHLLSPVTVCCIYLLNLLSLVSSSAFSSDGSDADFVWG